MEHGRRHTDPAARARASGPVRLSAPALRTGHEPGHRPAARDAGDVVADAPGAARLAAHGPARRAATGAERAPGSAPGGDGGAAHRRWSAGRHPRRDLERRRGSGPRRLAHRPRRAVSLGRPRSAGGRANRDPERPGGRRRTRAAPDAPGRWGGAPAPPRERPADPARPGRRSRGRLGRAPLRCADRVRRGSGAPVARARVGASASRRGRRPRPVPRRCGDRPPQDPFEDGHLDPFVLLRRPDLRGPGARRRGDRPLLHRHRLDDRRDRVRRDRRGRAGAAPGRLPGGRGRGAGVARPRARALPPRRRGSRVVATAGAGDAGRRKSRHARGV